MHKIRGLGLNAVYELLSFLLSPIMYILSLSYFTHGKLGLVKVTKLVPKSHHFEEFKLVHLILISILLTRPFHFIHEEIRNGHGHRWIQDVLAEDQVPGLQGQQRTEFWHKSPGIGSVNCVPGFNHAMCVSSDKLLLSLCLSFFICTKAIIIN